MFRTILTPSVSSMCLRVPALYSTVVHLAGSSGHVAQGAVDAAPVSQSSQSGLGCVLSNFV